MAEDLVLELTVGNLNMISDYLLDEGLAWYEDKQDYRAQMRRSKINPSRYVVNGTKMVQMAEDSYIDLSVVLGQDPWVWLAANGVPPDDVLD